MTLIDALVAGSLFALACTGSLQLTAASAAHQRQTLDRDGLLERIERDRLQLQAHWRRSAPPTTGAAASADQAASADPEDCPHTIATLLASAAAVPGDPALQRQLLPSGDGRSLLVRWQARQEPSVLRQRLISPAGLGLCAAAPTQPQGAL